MKKKIRKELVKELTTKELEGIYGGGTTNITNSLKINWVYIDGKWIRVVA